MQVWNVLHEARWKYRTQKIAKNLPSWSIAQLSRAISSQLRHVSTIGKNLLKMVCNDFLVVKVNCWSCVFNIIKPIWILRNIKNKKIVEKSVWKCARLFAYFSQVMTSCQEKTTKQPIECWMLTPDRATTHRHNDKHRNRFLKHKRVK